MKPTPQAVKEGVAIVAFSGFTMILLRFCIDLIRSL